MRGVSQIRSLADMKTIISTHARSTPRQKGTTFLEILSLGMEKLRLEAELDWISKRQARIENRMSEIRFQMDERLTETKADLKRTPTKSPMHGSSVAGIPLEAGKWRNMPINY